MRIEPEWRIEESYIDENGIQVITKATLLGVSAVYDPVPPIEEEDNE